MNHEAAYLRLFPLVAFRLPSPGESQSHKTDGHRPRLSKSHSVLYKYSSFGHKSFGSFPEKSDVAAQCSPISFQRSLRKQNSKCYRTSFRERYSWPPYYHNRRWLQCGCRCGCCAALSQFCLGNRFFDRIIHVLLRLCQIPQLPIFREGIDRGGYSADISPYHTATRQPPAGNRST